MALHSPNAAYKLAHKAVKSTEAVKSTIVRNERTTKADKRERRKTHDKLAQLEAAHLAATQMQMRRPPD